MLFLIFFFTNPVVKEKAKLKLGLAIPTGAPVMLEKEIIDIPPLVADKSIKAWSYNQKEQSIYLVFYLLFLFLEFLQ